MNEMKDVNDINEARELVEVVIKDEDNKIYVEICFT
jgi:hypothetical protein